MMKITRKIIWEGGEDVDVCDDGEGGGGGGGAWAAVEKKSQGCIKFRLEVWKASSLAHSLARSASCLLPLPPLTTLKRANSRDERLEEIGCGSPKLFIRPMDETTQNIFAPVPRPQ